MFFELDVQSSNQQFTELNCFLSDFRSLLQYRVVPLLEKTEQLLILVFDAVHHFLVPFSVFFHKCFCASLLRTQIHMPRLAVMHKARVLSTKIN